RLHSLSSLRFVSHDILRVPPPAAGIGECRVLPKHVPPKRRGSFRSCAPRRQWFVPGLRGIPELPLLALRICLWAMLALAQRDRKSTRLNSSHITISYA